MTKSLLDTPYLGTLRYFGCDTIPSSSVQPRGGSLRNKTARSKFYDRIYVTSTETVREVLRALLTGRDSPAFFRKNPQSLFCAIQGRHLPLIYLNIRARVCRKFTRDIDVQRNDITLFEVVNNSALWNTISVVVRQTAVLITGDSVISMSLQGPINTRTQWQPLKLTETGKELTAY